MSEPGGIAARLAAVRARIGAAAQRVGRDPKTVSLVGSSKRKPATDVAEAVRAGLNQVGENYVQEAEAKISEVAALLAASGHAVPRWHMIGPLQRNKARRAVRCFDAIATLDRSALGESLERAAAAAGRTLEVLVQVNLSGEPQKGGAPREALAELLAASVSWRHCRLVGLMTVPAASSDPETARPIFAELRGLLQELRERSGGQALRDLSMGMSGDFEVAIEEGATIVRVGAAIFGPRTEDGP